MSDPKFPWSVPIKNTDEWTTVPWPAGMFIQGGKTGFVMRRDGGPGYITAFVEAFPDSTFIRGEGATIQEAEEAAWSKYIRYQACPEHEFESRGYKNGAGFCKRCGLFRSGVFTAEQLGIKCAVCGVSTFYSSWGDDFYCEEHALTALEKRDRRANGKRGHVSVIAEYMDSLATEMELEDENGVEADSEHGAP